MPYVTCRVEIDTDDIFEEMSDEALTDELARRKSGKERNGRNCALELIYEEFRRRGDAPKLLRDYIYENIGRIL